MTPISINCGHEKSMAGYTNVGLKLRAVNTSAINIRQDLPKQLPAMQGAKYLSSPKQKVSNRVHFKVKQAVMVKYSCFEVKRGKFK